MVCMLLVVWCHSLVVTFYLRMIENSSQRVFSLTNQILPVKKICKTVFPLFTLSFIKLPAVVSPNLLGLSQQLKMKKDVVRGQVTGDMLQVICDTKHKTHDFFSFSFSSSYLLVLVVLSACIERSPVAGFWVVWYPNSYKKMVIEFIKYVLLMELHLVKNCSYLVILIEITDNLNSTSGLFINLFLHVPKFTFFENKNM